MARVDRTTPDFGSDSDSDSGPSAGHEPKPHSPAALLRLLNLQLNTQNAYNSSAYKVQMRALLLKSQNAPIPAPNEFYKLYFVFIC